MNALFEVLTTAGVVIAGLLIRLAVFVGLLALFSLPILAGIYAFRGCLALRDRIRGTVDAGGVHYKPGYRYTEGHTWLVEEVRKVFRFGLDDLAQRIFPDARTIVLPAPGTTLRKGESAAEILAGDRRASIPAPFDGVVVDVNLGAVREPAIVNREPYRRGWLLRMRPDDGAAEGRVGREARRWLGEENVRLHRFYEAQLGLAAADGGLPERPFVTLLPADQWKELTRSFLRSA